MKNIDITLQLHKLFLQGFEKTLLFNIYLQLNLSFAQPPEVAEAAFVFVICLIESYFRIEYNFQ